MPRPSSNSSRPVKRVRPSGRLADLASVRKNNYLLLGDIQKFLLARIDEPSGRRQDVIHPSEMAKADWCPRSTWYRLKNEPVSDVRKRHGYQMENIFDEGHTIHDKWQRRLWDMGLLEGMWLCQLCGNYWWGTAPSKCPEWDCEAGKDVIKYVEVPIDGEDKYLISGREDGKVGNMLVEIKSIGMGTLRMESPKLLSQHTVPGPSGKKIYDLDGLWKGLTQPLPSHLRQTMIYASIANEMMGMGIERVVFLYEYKSNQDVKEFSVPVRSTLSAPLLDSALAIKYALENNTEVPRPEGFMKEKKPCTECPWQSKCWSDDTTSGSVEIRSGDVESGPTRRSRATKAGDGGDRPARASRRARTAPAERPDRTGRLVADDVIPADDGVERISGGSTGRSGGRRVVRRRGDQASGEPVSST